MIAKFDHSDFGLMDGVTPKTQKEKRSGLNKTRSNFGNKTGAWIKRKEVT